MPGSSDGRNREAGFTLIELLTVVTILGVLAAVAIPVFVNQRERAWEAAVVTDVRFLVTAQEVVHAEAGAYTTDVATLESTGYVDATSVEKTLAVATNGDAYCIAARHMSNADDVWYFGTQGALSSSAGTGCPLVAAPTF